MSTNIADAVRLTNFRGPVESANKILCDFVLGGIRRRAEIADLEHVAGFVDLTRSVTANARHKDCLLTRMLSGLMSAWSTLHFRNRLKPKNIC